MAQHRGSEIVHILPHSCFSFPAHEYSDHLEVKYVGGNPRITVPSSRSPSAPLSWIWILTIYQFYDTTGAKVGDTVDLSSYDGPKIDALLAEKGFSKRP
jgi:hypothetical protein